MRLRNRNRNRRATMVMSKIWSRLPTDLICIIISQTDDLATLSDWCEASEYCTVIRRTALLCRCRRLTIDSFNVLLDPTLELEWRRKKWDNQLERTWFSKEVGYGDIPASYAQELNLLLCDMLHASEANRRKGSMDGDPWRNQSVMRRRSNHPTFIQDIEYTLDLVLSTASNLQRIAHSGHLTTECLNIITKRASPGCRSLSFYAEKHHHGTLLYAPGLSPYINPQYLSIDWSRLVPNPTLRILRIMQLQKGGGKSLAIAVSALKNLEELYIVGSPGPLFWSERESKLQSFTDNTFPASTITGEQVCQLPSSLRSLTLIEPYCSPHIEELRIMDVAYPGLKNWLETNSLPHLKHVHINFPSQGPASSLVAWFRKSPLLSITVPGVLLEEDQPTCTFLSPIDLYNNFAALQKVTFLGICRASSERAMLAFPPEQDLGFKVTSLVVGTRTSSLTEDWRSTKKDSEPQIFSQQMLFGSQLCRAPQIRHLRLEQVETRILSLSDFDFHEFHSLRVLMLYPWADPDSSPPRMRRPRAKRNKSDKTKPSTDIDIWLPPPRSPEADLLDRVCSHAPEHLRIVFIGSYRIWLKRRADLSDSNASKVPVPMSLEQAKSDAHESAAMGMELSGYDWEFLHSVPQKPVEDLERPMDYWDGRCCWGVYRDMVTRERSYCVLTRTHAS